MCNLLSCAGVISHIGLSQTITLIAISLSIKKYIICLWTNERQGEIDYLLSIETDDLRSILLFHWWWNCNIQKFRILNSNTCILQLFYVKFILFRPWKGSPWKLYELQIMCSWLRMSPFNHPVLSLQVAWTLTWTARSLNHMRLFPDGPFPP